MNGIIGVPEMLSILITGIFTLIAAFIGAAIGPVITRGFASKIHWNNLVRERRLEVYEQFYPFLVDVDEALRSQDYNKAFEVVQKNGSPFVKKHRIYLEEEFAEAWFGLRSGINDLISNSYHTADSQSAYAEQLHKKIKEVSNLLLEKTGTRGVSLRKLRKFNYSPLK